jgi:putative flippase GtrA
VSKRGPSRQTLRHYGGFLLAGGLAFVTDVGVFQLFNVLLSVAPLMARPVSISIAMIVSWAINRTITFPTTSPPTLAEFLHFAAFAWAAAAFNYAVFAALLWAWPELWKPLAIFIASLAAMVMAYVNMRYSVFRR